MIETSGRDIAMFNYIDYLFPTNNTETQYRKLALNFKINDISFAENSVDTRMLKEMVDGQNALKSFENSNFEQLEVSECIRNIINANAGGPYGSEVLKGE